MQYKAIFESAGGVMFMYVSGNKAVEKNSKMLKFHPYYFKTQKMCEKVV